MSMIDLNTAEEQGEGSGRGALPPDSIVMVQMNLRYPEAGKEGSMQGLTRARSGLEYLNCEFVVAAGSFQGAKFWNNLNVAGATTTGQKTAIDISMRTIRAMVEASRNINPKDASPQATQGRVLQSWDELNGIYFPVMVGCEVSEPRAKDGKRFVNNTLKRVITPDRPEYEQVWNGGEIITANPLPEIPATATSAKPGWAAPAPQAAPMAPPAAPPFAQAAPAAPPAAPQAAAPRPAPNWAQTPPPANAPF